MTRETITLTQAEQQRVIVLTAVRERHVGAARAAALLGGSLRHCPRPLAAFRRGGPAPLAPGDPGPPAPHPLPPSPPPPAARAGRPAPGGVHRHHLHPT